MSTLMSVEGEILIGNTLTLLAVLVSKLPGPSLAVDVMTAVSLVKPLSTILNVTETIFYTK